MKVATCGGEPHERRPEVVKDTPPEAPKGHKEQKDAPSEGPNGDKEQKDTPPEALKGHKEQKDTPPGRPKKPATKSKRIPPLKP